MGKTTLTTLLLFIGVCLFGQTIYVKENGTGDGSSWVNASGDLADALSKSTFGRDIWLAEGKYTPVSCTTCGQAERSTAFVITSGAKIYGGFGGWESDLSERKPDVFKSILSGDIDGDNTLANNSYTIIFTENVSNQTLVDGVTISDGNADFPDAAFGDRHNSGGAWFNKSGLPGDASHPVVKNVIFKNNRANGFGAAFYSNGSFGASNAPVFENVVFEDNIAGEEGGGFYGNGSFGGLCNPEFRNCTFKKNEAIHNSGGAFSLTGSEQGVGNAIFEDCLFEENEAGFSGGAIHSFGKSGQSNSILRRCTFLLNRSAEGGAIYSDGSFSGYSVPIFEECYFEKNEATGSGGAFYGNGIFQGVSSPVFKTCRFFKNKALGLHGGAVANLGSENGIANANFEDCVFEENEALLNGGAIFNFGLKGHSNPVLKRCTFKKNIAREGAGMYSDASFNGECNPDVSDCIFLENHAGGDGGAVYNLSASDGLCQGKFERCVFEKNTCENAGGAVLNNGASGGSCVPAFTNCRFIENTTPNYGAAMYNIGNSGHSNPTINNCLFARNYAYSSGAIYNLGSNSGESSPRITNCTFFGNKAKVGSTIYCNAENEMGLSAPLISNCIFYGNYAETGRVFRLIYGKPTVEFCLFDIDSCEVLNDGLNGEVNCGNGLIFSNELVFEDTLNGNFRLKSTASIIDAGNSQATQTANIQQDLDGNPRIVNSVVDYGAYEFMGGGVVAPTISQQPSNKEICEGENITLSVIASGNSSLDFQWRKDGTAISGATLSSYTILGAAVADAASYSCVVSNSAGSIESAWAIVSVNETVVFTLDLSLADTNVCEGSEIVISTVLENGGANPQYEWSLNGTPLAGQSNSSIKVIANKNTEEYRCEAITSETCPDNPTQFSVAVVRGQEVVIPTLSINGSDSICIGESVVFSAIQTFGGTVPTYNWLVNGVPTGDVTDTFSSVGLAEGDVVKCEMRSSEKCPNEEVIFSNEVVINYKDCTGVATENLFDAGAVSVFPNPTSNEINIAFEKQFLEMLISVFDSQGQVVFKNIIPSGVSNFKIEVADFPNGIYFVRLENEENFGTSRISKF